MTLNVKRFYKGVSPLVAEIVMISLVVMLMVVFASWTDFFSSESTEKTDERYNNMLNCANVNAKVSDMFYDVGKQEVKILIQNLVNNNIYPVNYIEVYSRTGDVCRYDQDVIINPGEFKVITFNCPEGFITSCQEIKSVIISSNCVDKSLYLDEQFEISASNVCRATPPAY